MTLTAGSSKRLSQFNRHKNANIYVNDSFLKKQTCLYILSKLCFMEKQEKNKSSNGPFTTYSYTNQTLITLLLKKTFNEVTNITKFLSGISDINMSMGSITELEPGQSFWEHDDRGYQVMGKSADGTDIVRVPPRYSAVLYLNDDYDGGEFVIESMDFCIKPKSGLLVIFDSHYRHKVEVVKNSNRYAIASFDTYLN